MAGISGDLKVVLDSAVLAVHSTMAEFNFCIIGLTPDIWPGYLSLFSKWRGVPWELAK